MAGWAAELEREKGSFPVPIFRKSVIRKNMGRAITCDD
jgi:hypothetical protein